MTPDSVKYDPAVIQEFARRLYVQADKLVWAWAIRVGLLSGAIGVAGSFLGEWKRSGVILVLVFALVGGLLGAAYGREKGFELRLRAQEALCMLQVEINSRRA